MYAQRYIPHLPAAGEVMIFDRSWYNRVGVVEDVEEVVFQWRRNSSGFRGCVAGLVSVQHNTGPQPWRGASARCLPTCRPASGSGKLVKYAAGR
jgi:Polyphosphate kinase 2 (PPK2)